MYITIRKSYCFTRKSGNYAKHFEREYVMRRFKLTRPIVHAVCVRSTNRCRSGGAATRTAGWLDREQRLSVMYLV